MVGASLAKIAEAARTWTTRSSQAKPLRIDVRYADRLHYQTPAAFKMPLKPNPIVIRMTRMPNAFTSLLLV